MELYCYKAKVVKVVDGDTVTLDIDLGFKLWWKVNCRLADINALELGKGGEKARDYVMERLIPGQDVEIKSRKLDKYGRPVITLYYNGVNINENLILTGHAQPYKI